MNAVELLRSAARGMTANKLRSVLTMLGVLIGVAAVILLLAVGNGSAQQVQSAIADLGTTTLTVRANGGGGFGAATTSTTSRPLTLQVADELADARLGHIASVVPEATTSATVSDGSASETAVSVIGTTPQYFTASTAQIARGAAFDQTAVDDAAHTVVIGSTIEQELFPTGNAVGGTVDVGGIPFTVSGVLATQSAVGFTDPNAVVVAPVSRVQRSFTGFGALTSLQLRATSSDDVTAAGDEAQIMLDQYLGVPADATTQPFTITSQSQLLQTRAASLATFTVLLGAVAAISLLVGGIGVTNVMLVTVTERTREIGIRKALGATRLAILGQFVVEAAALTLLGGIAGVVVALVGAQFTIDGTQPVLLGWSIPLALGVSVVIGVFFGVYPAARAAAMRPIQALRSV